MYVVESCKIGFTGGGSYTLVQTLLL